MKVGRLLTIKIEGKLAFFDPEKSKFAYVPDSDFQTLETDRGDVIFTDPMGKVLDLAWHDAHSIDYRGT